MYGELYARELEKNMGMCGNRVVARCFASRNYLRGCQRTSNRERNIQKKKKKKKREIKNMGEPAKKTSSVEFVRGRV